MSKLIATIENEPILEEEDGRVHYIAKAAIDSDGVGLHHGDHTAQNETTYKPDLNADIDKYIVVPPAIVHGVTGVVIGCQAHVTNTINGQETDAVVGDVGPHLKLGEIACSTASAIGLNPSPVDGGADANVIEYQLWPGKAAVVDGKMYQLQAHPGVV